jgi:hypothetical protein
MKRKDERKEKGIKKKKKKHGGEASRSAENLEAEGPHAAESSEAKPSDNGNVATRHSVG